MNHKVTAYGLTEEQVLHLAAALPDGYEVVAAECVTDLVVANTVCSIVDTAKLDRDARNALLCYYMDMGDRLDETVVWLGAVRLPELPSFVRCDSFLDLLTGLNPIVEQAQSRYDTMQMYGDAYAYLPKHAVAESMEADVYAALHRRYGDNPDPQLVGQVRREFQAVLQADAAEELAAVYELTRWLKGNGHPFRLDCKTAFPFLLLLLDITEEALPQQKDPLETGYVFHLPEGLQPKIRQWQKHHWLLDRRENPLGNVRFDFAERKQHPMG